MVEAQTQLKLKRAFKNQFPKGHNCVYIPRDQVLVCRENIVKNRIGEFIGPFTLQNHDL